MNGKTKGNGSQKSGRKQESLRVLMVEDDPAYRTFVKHLLKQDAELNVEFIAAASMSQCREYLKNEIADVILLDLSLPDSRGIETVKSAIQAALGIPIIVLTGKEDDAYGIMAVGLGAQDYLLKHKISNDALLSCIRFAIERKRFEESSLRLAALRDFTFTLAHDLQVPMIGADNVLKSLLSGEFGQLSAEQKGALNILDESNSSQLGLVRKLLEVYKYETESRNYTFQVINLAELLSRCLERKFSHHSFELSIPENLPALRGVSEALECMFDNIFENAIKYGNPDSTVSISAESTETRISVHVHNQGPSMPDELRSGMFERFWQGVPGKTYVAQTGLGLYLCHRIAAMHKARLICESSDKSGTTITVRFPLS